MAKKPTQETVIALMAERIGDIREDIGEIKARINNHYVTKTEFEPIKKLVYGMVGLILTSFLGTLIALVFRQ